MTVQGSPGTEPGGDASSARARPSDRVARPGTDREGER